MARTKHIHVKYDVRLSEAENEPPSLETWSVLINEVKCENEGWIQVYQNI